MFFLICEEKNGLWIMQKKQQLHRSQSVKIIFRWEMATSRLFQDQDLLGRADMDDWILQFARIEW